MIDQNTWIVAVLLGVLVGLAWWRGGPELVGEGLGNGARLLLRFGVVIVLSFLAAGLAEHLVPSEWVSRSLGGDSGLRGILLASAAGVVTPAGPFVSMPVAVAMLRAGAGVAPVVAFLTAWMVLALHRLVAWEIPLLGPRFALMRWSLSLFLPVVAGLATRAFVRG